MAGWKQYFTFPTLIKCSFIYSYHLFTDKKGEKKDSSDSSRIIISDCVLWTVTRQTVTFLSAESSLSLEPCPNWIKDFFVCVFHDSEKLFMHSHYFLNLLSKCLKCTVKIYFLSLLADCFLFCMAPKNIKIINHLQLHSLVCIYFLIRACFSVLRHTRGRYCLFLISIRLFFFLFFFRNITSRQMVRFSGQITLDM